MQKNQLHYFIFVKNLPSAIYVRRAINFMDKKKYQLYYFILVKNLPSAITLDEQQILWTKINKREVIDLKVRMEMSI